ncbi:RluA family pseudouridine synthase [Clostridium tyrobutyricum]|jgi:23S rRNA pseudouridine1911/1915/1917 synthase|uniref:RluA family pseudouridine synthase n=1 Tax=Clostridium tyrobutyricum TaxID=1519 RepID=UPI00057ECDA0|nr:RluA family pseudouridine synthase [Clostridium tyrobutyricum]MBV4430805.1 RluA family pseudouridine synthase [Clostridium tyrobutyricum]MBV4439495.1 RluA family pseudouridine synthase [Clostridium tyrobutyricum]MBV4445602.1 RluA family pseudouridine synthase [Clostridium tyrobutyricum]MBV4448676.1 RluA family pseudouridine synthase [Clostridium tyrobutyricum]MEA5007506.1 RluA family pseudouridine synthase [Clostridium tyrobutyricum]
MEHKNKLLFNIKEDEQGLKLREYLRRNQRLSGRLIKSAALDGRIEVNNKRAKLNYVIKSKDLVSVDICKKETQNIDPEKMDLDVAYEDDDIIVVNKRPGMVVHPTKCYQSGTLANGLIYHFRQNGEQCIVRLVSRLDMDTSGLVIVGKNQFSHMALARDMKGEDFEKSYIAVVHNTMIDTKGVIDLPIYKPEGMGIKRIIDERGQKSITHYSVLKSLRLGDVVKLTLETGRTHQIRVHLSNIGYPIYGDTLYCEEDDSKYITRQALHAYRLRFPHPRTGNILEIETELPKDMQELIEEIS